MNEATLKTQLKKVDDDFESSYDKKLVDEDTKDVYKIIDEKGNIFDGFDVNKHMKSINNNFTNKTIDNIFDPLLQIMKEMFKDEKIDDKIFKEYIDLLKQKAKGIRDAKKKFSAIETKIFICDHPDNKSCKNVNEINNLQGEFVACAYVEYKKNRNITCKRKKIDNNPTKGTVTGGRSKLKPKKKKSKKSKI